MTNKKTDCNNKEAVKELETLLKEAEQKLDDINAKAGIKGSLCGYCHSETYYGKEGIIHEDTCLIKRIRKALQEGMKG